MRKKMFLYGTLSVMLISGCTQVENISPTSTNGSMIMQDKAETSNMDNLESSMGEVKDSIKESREEQVIQDLSTTRESLSGSEEVVEIAENESIKNELTIQDILIPEDECLKNTPFMAGSVECILDHYPDLERIRSEEGANGYFNYWMGDGIEYITYAENSNISGVVISANYSLNCGLRIGMEEKKLQQYFPCMEKLEKKNLMEGQGLVVFAGAIMNDEMGPLQTTDYDCVYAYVHAASDEEVDEYQISGTTAYSVTAFINNEEVCKIVLDRPTAG